MNEDFLLGSLPSLLVKKDTIQLLTHNGKKYELRLDFNDIFSDVVILNERKFLLQNDFYSLLVVYEEEMDKYDVIKFEQLPYYNKIEDDLFYFESESRGEEMRRKSRFLEIVTFINLENKFRIIMKIKISSSSDPVTLLYAKKRYILVLYSHLIMIYDIIKKKQIKIIDSHSDVTSMGGKLNTIRGEEVFISGYGKSTIGIWKLDDNLNIEEISSIPLVSEIPHLSISDNIFFLSPYLYSYDEKSDKYKGIPLKSYSEELSFSTHSNILFSKNMLIFPNSTQFNFDFQTDQKIINVFSKDVIITQIESTGVFSIPEIRINVYNKRDKTYQVSNTVRARRLLLSFPMREKEKRKIFSKYFTNIDLSKDLINVIIRFL